MRKPPVPVLLLLVFLSAAFDLRADDYRTLLVSGVFADSSIAGPLLRYSTGDVNSDHLSVMLIGGTLDAQWVKGRGGRDGWLVSADITPFNAHLSDHIYVDGKRAREHEYEAGSYRIRTGMRFAPSDASTTDIQLVGFMERVSDIDDARVRDFWEGPFLGIDLAHNYRRVSAENLLTGSMTGFVASARLEAFAGSEAWSRASVSVRGGQQKGRVHLRQSLLVIGGKEFNIVNRVLVGGSWDLLGEHAVYGHRYGEFRVARAVLANGGVDYALPRNWRIGARASYLRSDVANVYGAALNASKVWKTFGFNFGVGIPRKREGNEDAVVYIAVIAPLFAR